MLFQECGANIGERISSINLIYSTVPEIYLFEQYSVYSALSGTKRVKFGTAIFNSILLNKLPV